MLPEITAILAGILITTRTASLPFVTFMTPLTNGQLLRRPTRDLQADVRTLLPAHVQLLDTTLGPLQQLTAVPFTPPTYLALHHGIMERLDASDPLRGRSLTAWQRCLCYEAAVALGHLTGEAAVLELEREALARLVAAGTPEPVGRVIVSLNAGEPEITYPPEPGPVERIAAGFHWPPDIAEEVVIRLLTA